MSLVGKSSFLFLSLSVLAAALGYWPLSFVLAWFGLIQILNAAAPRWPFSRAIHWLHAMTFEPFAFLGAIATRLLPVKESHIGSGQPILLVHGYANHGCVWRLQKKRLEALGLGPIYTINLGHPFRSIHHYAEKVKAKAEGIAAQTGRKDLILIGHSMGGLVSSLYATKLAFPNTVTHIITIGSPLSGTPLARIAIGPNAREMEPNSAFTQELKQAIASKKEIRFHHIATKSDQIVIPGASALIKDNKHVIYEDLGHQSLLYSTRVANQISKWLNLSDVSVTTRRLG